ncbi:MAG: NADPH-dependent FMN reductase [Candidatus Micrarchaeaceae archaeon]
MENVKILGLSGSLRRGSFHSALLRAAKELLPEGAELEIYDISKIPFFNQDLEQSIPEEVQKFKEAIRKADALLFASPEYNHSISGVLKNAIDWASRPPNDNVFDGKPAAIISASTGAYGGIRAQYHLRQVFVYLNIHAINRPQIAIPFADQKFDKDGNLIDEKVRENLREQLKSLVDWAIRIKRI